MLAQVVVTRKGVKLPDRSVALNTTGPGTDAMGRVEAASLAHGRIPETGVVMVEIPDAQTVSCYVWSKASGKWRYPGSDSGSYQKEFTEAQGHIDFFEGPPGALFRLVLASGTTNAFHSGDAV